MKKLNTIFFTGLLLCAQFSIPAAPAHADLNPTGMVKPLAGLRDYNSTYTGTPGSGSVGYTTLFRDNEDSGAASGCQGEGCGSHPGVDILVPSGTPVYAMTSGYVTFSGVNGGWGGLVTIRSVNPHNPGEYIFTSYAHLRERSVSQYQTVSTGQMIGRSGGALSDPNHGSSTGAHLHFQIDRNHSLSKPSWVPSGRTVNSKDHDFQVAGRTYNPVVFATGGYQWTFAQPGNRENWQVVNAQSVGMQDNALWVDSANDPYIWRTGLVNCGLAKPCSGAISAEANTFKHVGVDLYNNCFSNPLQVFFTTNTSPTWDEAKSVKVYLPYGGAFRGNLYLGGNPYWSGIITGIRIDPMAGCSTAFDPTWYGNLTVQK